MDTDPKLSVDEVQLKAHASNWEEAIQVAAKPLVDGKKITNDYVTAMIDSVKKLGPYIVIAPGLALGHARPSEAVHQTGFAIATLAEPVKFGNKDNDPVDLVVILASTSDTAHLSLLQKIVMFLNDSQNLETLRRAKTREDAKHIAEQINGGDQ
ncbi:PTS sugar transporter subunit IIA [Furfurilactobacillus rossiae]|nr:PTS sugar transporter subunit IIA [Furfurilactobacillus rossiae]QFR67367.1 PTS sugar transporter subunit IIA [Furfurilactobacillus rossiae]QLE60306.1 transcriptional antiterminator BglG - PTS system mannitol-fructose-specific IIA [Furfurilactobacillus rossiae]